MMSFNALDTVGEVVTERPHLSRTFEKVGIDYCCGGKKTLAQVCEAKGLDPNWLLKELENSTRSSDNSSTVDVSRLTLSELVDHIEQTHHRFLISELPRIDGMTKKVASAHGKMNPRLHEIREIFLAMAAELISHMQQEEDVVFPRLRVLDQVESPTNPFDGKIAIDIGLLESDHDNVGLALSKLHDLSNAFSPPDWACNTYRAMLDALENLTRDLHQHIHKENNVLFPLALKQVSIQRN